MYRSKERGKNRIEVFTPDLDHTNRRRLSLESQLRKGLERGELCVYYQPRLDIPSGRVVAVEALLRWRSSDDELRLPEEFLDVAEDSGLIVPIGKELIAAACAQLGRWHGLGHRRLALAFDLSARQIKEAGLVAFLRQQLEAAGVGAERLEIELSEHALMSTNGAVADVLASLGELGVRILLDDFGTGRSLICNLKKLPISGLKLDRSVVAGLPRSHYDAAIARSIICLARSVGLPVIADGVMSSDQLDTLGRIGCHQMQGTLLCPPLPPEHLDDFLGAVHSSLRRRLEDRPCLGFPGATCTGRVTGLDCEHHTS
jgi:EAL domain-containing protein (putative c-di-GMP-specific phosphodiesterase class I)